VQPQTPKISKNHQGNTADPKLQHGAIPPILPST